MRSEELVHIHISQDLQSEATTVLAKMGLTITDVVNMTLTLVVRERALPFELRMPNAETRAAMQETRELANAQRER